MPIKETPASYSYQQARHSFCIAWETQYWRAVHSARCSKQKRKSLELAHRNRRNLLTGTRAFKVDTKAQAPPWARHKHKPSESKRLPGFTTGVLQKQSSGITPVPQCTAAHLPKTRSPLAACVWPCTLASSCRGLAPCSSGQSRRRICAGVREHS